MKNLVYLATALFAFSMVGCSGSSSSSTKDSDGHCSESIVEAHNQVILDAQSYQTFQDADHLTGLKNSCQSFKNAIGSDSCTAVNTTTHESDTLSYSGSIQKACDTIIAN